MDNISRESSFLSDGALDTIIRGVSVTDLDMILKSDHILGFGELPDSTLETPVIFPVSTCALPSTEDYAGPYSFDVELSKSVGGKLEHSSKLNKLFVVMNSKVPLKFKVKAVEPLFIRVLPIFLDEESIAEPVKRCPTHISNREKSNEGFPYVNHIIRCDKQEAIYHENPESRRLSVVVPTESPQPGSDAFTLIYSFMCKNSCALGMNRRSTALIFTLERKNGEVVGRKLLNFRVCSCPRRDKAKEESFQSHTNAVIESERHIMKLQNSEKKTKCLKRSSSESVTIRIPKKYLKINREMLLLHKTCGEFTEEDDIFLEDIEKNLQR